MPMNRVRVRQLIQTFDLQTLFTQEMGWSYPATNRASTLVVDGQTFTYTPLAELSGVQVLSVTPLASSKTRARVQQALEKVAHENLLIFLDDARHPTHAVWYWMKREGGKRYPRQHEYLKGQTGELFLTKIDGLVVEMDEFRADGTVSLTKVTGKLAAALDIERVTKQFYQDFSKLRETFIDRIEGIERESDRFWYASVLLNRLMFIFFLQKKGFIQNNTRYLDDKLAGYVGNPDLPPRVEEGVPASGFYREFLHALFFEGFAKPAHKRTPTAHALLGEIKYLNGGLFLPHRLENKYTAIHIPDGAFVDVLTLFNRYSWHLDDTVGGADDEINPDVLGYIFEKYINQKAFGAYYTRPEITNYLCERTIHAAIVAKVNEQQSERTYETMGELYTRLDAKLCRLLLDEILPKLSLLDPACGSGAFLVAGMKTLLDVYAAVFGKLHFVNDPYLRTKLDGIERAHPSLNYYIRKRIITENLYGVDIMEEATEIARLRLFLFLVSSARTVDELEPLPNIDFNIMQGNSLIGLLTVDEKRFDKHEKGSTQKSFLGGDGVQAYRTLLSKKNLLIKTYKETADGMKDAHDLKGLRDSIEDAKKSDYAVLNGLLLEDFQALGIRYEAYTESKGKSKPTKRPLVQDDIDRLQPFHWGYEFDEIMERGGFDVIIANPPWETFKPQAKEFFAGYSDTVTKNKMTIKDFEKELEVLLKDPAIAGAWSEYQSRFPHVSLYYRSTPQFANQISVVNGKKAGTDINLYKLFTEQAQNLLRAGGECGIVIPSGIYSDLGTKQLREMLFDHTQLTGLFGFENRKTIFEGVDSRFKFVVMTWRKGGATTRFPAAFMRHDVGELETFPNANSLWMDVATVRRLAPDSLSVPEFKSELDAHIANKMGAFPLLGETLEGTWNVKFTSEFHMTNDSHLFHQGIAAPSPLNPLSHKGRGDLHSTFAHWEKAGDEGIGEGATRFLPLYEGKMIHQFTHQWEGASTRYWIQESEGRKALLGKTPDRGQVLGYQTYRLAIRAIASSTNERTLIAGVVPKNVFCGNSALVMSALDASRLTHLSGSELLVASSIINSFVVDSILRQTVSANINMFYLYQLPIPRLKAGDPYFDALVWRAARLVCTTPEFDELARSLVPSPLNPTRGRKVRPHKGRGDLDAPLHKRALTPKSPLPQGARGLDSTFTPAQEARGLDSTFTPLQEAGGLDSTFTPLQEAGDEGIGAVDEGERAQLRAEIDGMVAHLYGLTESEFAHILATFPLVPEATKQAALGAYRAFAQTRPHP